MEEKKLFKEFLNSYLGNVKKELPESYRAQQLEMGGDMARLVEEFETKFLEQPFNQALKKQKDDLWKSVDAYLHYVTENVDVGLLVSHGWSHDFIPELNKLRNKFGLKGIKRKKK